MCEHPRQPCKLAGWRDGERRQETGLARPQPKGFGLYPGPKETLPEGLGPAPAWRDWPRGAHSGSVLSW